MTLLELLVQELPKCGGWPNCACVAKSYSHIPDVLFWDDNGITVPFHSLSRDAVGNYCVTREHYEATLAASEQPEWDEDGKPGIGVTCEHCPGGATQTEWEVVTVLGVSKRPGGMFTDYWLRKEDGSSYIIGNPYRFRPIRTEAERKREEAILAMRESLGHAAGLIEVSNIYRAIAAGKIPGIKLAD